MKKPDWLRCDQCGCGWAYAPQGGPLARLFGVKTLGGHCGDWPIGRPAACRGVLHAEVATGHLTGREHEPKWHISL